MKPNRLQTGLSLQPASGLPEPASKGWIGDWLLTFRTDGHGLPCRSLDNTWRLMQEGSGWHLWVSSPGDSWHGTPYLAFETATWQGWLLGEMYGTAEPVKTIERVLGGDKPATTLNGHFLLPAYDRRKNEWHIWTNRFATFHGYHATDGHKAAIGTYYPAVAEAAGRTELDWEALTCLFGFGFCPGERTHFRGVQALRPATHYHLNSDGQLAAQTRYWEWHHSPDEQRSDDDTLATFADIFARVMDELVAAGRIAVPISGGLDSRSTVAAIKLGDRERDRFWFYSYGYSDNSIETRIAGQVAAARGLPFTSHTIRPYLFDRLEEVNRTLEGFQDVVIARQAFVTDQLRRNADYVIAAHWGDVFLDDMGLSEASADSISHTDLAALALKKVSKPAGWLLAELCQPQLAGTRPDDLLREVINAEIAPYRDIVDPDFRLKAFKTENWSARWTTVGLRMYQAGAFPRLPFYDTRLSDFFMTVPTRVVANRHLQIEYLKRYAPDLAAVSWQVTGSDLFRSKRNNAWVLPRAAFQKGVRHLTGRRVIERNWEIQFLDRQGRENLKDWLTSPGLQLHHFISPQTVNRLLDAFFMNPLANHHGYTLSLLLTFSVWLESFGGKRRGA